MQWGYSDLQSRGHILPSVELFSDDFKGTVCSFEWHLVVRLQIRY